MTPKHQALGALSQGDGNRRRRAADAEAPSSLTVVPVVEGGMNPRRSGDAHTVHAVDVTRLQTEHITASSAPRGWAGFGVDLRQHQRPSEGRFPDGFRQVIVAMHLTSPGRFVLEHNQDVAQTEDAEAAVTVIPARTSCALSWTRPCDSLHLRLEPQFLEKVWSDMEGSAVDLEDLTPQVASGDQGLKRVTEALLQEARMQEARMQEARMPAPGTRLYVDALGQQAAILLRRGFAHPGASPPSAAPRNSSAAIRRAKAYLREHLAEDIGLEEAARAGGMSRFHFAREFKLATGLTPHQFLMRQRLLHAQELLRRYGRSRTLAQVAAEAGFFDQSHLTRHFRRHLGTTPAAWLL